MECRIYTCGPEKTAVAHSEELREGCADRHDTILGEYSDKSTGSDWEKRPALLRCCAESKRGQTILVRDVDKLFGSKAYAVLFGRLLSQKGVLLMDISDTASQPLSSALTRFMAQLDWMDDFQQKTRTERVRLHRERVGNGDPTVESTPYGWKRDPNKPNGCVKNYDELVTVDGIVQRYKDGYPIRKIERWLNTAGIPTRCGGKWHPQQIVRILKAQGVDDSLNRSLMTLL